MSVKIREQRRVVKREKAAYGRKDSREACTGVCIRTLKTSAGAACKNRFKPDSCANCLRFSNYKP